jgi:hypothetical protein
MPEKTLDASTTLDLFDTDVEVDFSYANGEVTIDVARINDEDVTAMFTNLLVARVDTGSTMSVRDHLADTVKSQIDAGLFDDVFDE